MLLLFVDCLVPEKYLSYNVIYIILLYSLSKKLRVAADGKCGDADAQALYLAHSRPAGFGGGASGYDIVDEEYVLALQCVRLFYGKDALHIFKSLYAVFVRLRIGVASAHQIVADDRSRECLGYAFAK